MNQMQIPKGWKSDKFSNLTESFDGLRVPLNKSQRQKMQGEFPYYGATGQVDSINDYKFDGRFLLITEDASLANPLERKKPIAYIVEGKFWVNNHAHVIKTKDDLDLDFLCYYMNAIKIMDFAKTQQTRPKLTKSDLNNIPIVYPSLPTQKEIVRKLDYFLNKYSTKKKQIIQLLSKFNSETIHKSYENHLITLALNGLLLDVEPDYYEKYNIMIPNGWDLKNLSDLALEGSDKFTDGPFGSRLKVSDYTESGYPIIRLQNIGVGRFIDKNWKFTSQTKFSELIRHSAEPGDIIISKMAEPVCRAALIPPIFKKYLIAADCIKIRINETKALPRYLVYAINSPFVRNQAEKKSKGATRLRVNLSDVKKLLIPLPKIETQKKIVEILDKKFQEWEIYKPKINFIERQYEHSKKSLENIIISVLNSAFSGKLIE